MGTHTEEIFGTDYSVTSSGLIKYSTIGTFLLFICMGLFIPPVMIYYEAELIGVYVLVILLAVIAFIVFPFAWAISPRKYTVSGSGVFIDRPIKTIFIPMKDIKKVEVKDKNYFTAIRMGSGGLFSISGKLYTRTEGWFYIYVKNRNYVMIHATEKWVISPDDRELFITDVKGKLEKAKGSTHKAKSRSK